MATLATNQLARASDVDSEHLFGFTEGADIGKTGEREAETETIGRFGKSAGSYAAVTQNDSVKVLTIENFRISANALLAYFGVSGVPDLQDRQLATLLGASFETRFMLMDRHRGPFGLTIIAEPRWGRVDATSGESLTSYGGMFTVVADRELIDNRLFCALNALYDAQATRFPIANLWVHDSKIGFSSRLLCSWAEKFVTCVLMTALAWIRFRDRQSLVRGDVCTWPSRRFVQCEIWSLSD